MDGTRLVSVMDREADVFALFAEQRRLGRVDLLVRAKVNRSQGKGRPKLFYRMRSGPTQGELKIEVQRSSARRARVQLRFKTVELRAPARAGLPCGRSWCMCARSRPPQGARRWSGCC